MTATDNRWSCPDCDDIGKMLTESEMATIMEAFERYDVDGDNALSVEEFLKYRASTSGLRGPASRELADIEMGSCVPLFLCSPVACSSFAHASFHRLKSKGGTVSWNQV